MLWYCVTVLVLLPHMVLSNCPPYRPRDCSPLANVSTAYCLACNEPPICKGVPTINITLLQGAYKSSPFVEPLILRRSDTKDISSACSTFFPLDLLGTFLQIRSVVYKNGTGIIETFIIKDRCPGEFRTQGRTNDAGLETSRVANEYVFGQNSSNCPEALLLYKCYVYDLYQWVHANTDFRFAIAPIGGNISQQCLNALEAKLNNPLYKFRGSNFVRPAQTLPLRCVTKFNGADCINSNRVAPQDSISIP